MPMLLQIILANVFVSLISLIGILTLAIKEKILEKILLILVALSAGVLIGSAFFDLIPEAIETGKEVRSIMTIIIIGFILFYLIEKILHWRHCHQDNCDIHAFARMNLVGDGVHNFIDGMILAAAFLTSPSLGIITTLAVTLHEIPQEIGDFGVLVHGGFKKNKALYLNLLTALTAVAGGIISYFLAGEIEGITGFLLPFAAGGFIYISASDLLPEIKKELEIKKALGYLAVFTIGVIAIYLL